MQINPPFDGSVPCPACSTEVRGVSALIHNFLTRVEDGRPVGKAYVRLLDLKEYHSDIDPAKFEHPDVVELMTVAKLLTEACAGMTQEGLTIRWTPAVTEAVTALVPRAEKASAAFNVHSESHFADDRHCRGEDNILRESQGSVGIRWLPKYSYHYKVECVDAGAVDLLHAPCGTGLKIDQHFKDNLARDPTFYGKVWCPKCRISAPFGQFEASTVPSTDLGAPHD